VIELQRKVLERLPLLSDLFYEGNRMKSRISNHLILRRLGKILGVALIFCGASQAIAIPGLPLGCAGIFGEGGCAPYSQVIFFGLPAQGSLFEYDPVTLDFSDTGTNGIVRGVADLANAHLKTYARGFDDGNPSTNNGVSITTQAADVFTLRRLGSPSLDLFTFSVVLTADGIGGIDNPGYTASAFAHLGGPSLPGFSGGTPDDFRVFQAGGNAPVFTDFAIHLMAFINLSARLDEPFELDYLLRTDVSERTVFDFLHTGRLNFIVPDGITVTSLGGFDSGVANAVPEPSTWLLLGSGLIALAWRRTNKSVGRASLPRAATRTRSRAGSRT
jgi:hypothetical protein